MLKTNHWQEGLQSLVLPLQASIQTFYYDRRTMLLLVSVGSSHSLARSLSGRRDIVHRVNQIMVGSVGVSTYHKGVLEFPLAASRALKALQQQQFFEMAGAACYFEDLNVEETTFLETISQILQAISNRQITTAIKGIRQIFDASKPHGLYTAETLKASVERVLTNFEIVSRGRELISLANQCRDAAQKVRNCHRYRELQNQVQELTDSIEAQLSEKEYSSHVQRAVAYIHTHYAQIRRVSEVSDMLLLSTEYFCRIFKQETGTTFNNYLTSYRIQTAKKLLETTDMKIADVAEAVGYPNLSYFSRVFKSKTGATPFHYRDSDF